MLNQPDMLQGKDAGSLNAYCGNILGNWDGCKSCHIGLGIKPESAPASDAQLANIDCLLCHQKDYKRKLVDGAFVPDTANMTITMDQAVQTVHAPLRDNCLQCHAKAGGGDAVKRGDLALATANTGDSHFDVHMAVTGGDLLCQDCHTPQNHRFPGKGSDLRVTDLDMPMACDSGGCHSSSPHDDDRLNGHTQRVACQTCHIPVYAKDANDTQATEATEIDRRWLKGTNNTSPPYHPVTLKANNLMPVYLHWNRYSDNVLLGDVMTMNPLTQTFETSVPDGEVTDPDSKLYPFKYKTSDYPLRIASNQLIALDTKVFFATADPHAATISGLVNMGFDANDDYVWVTTDTYQLLNHQVGEKADALGCTNCHLTTTRMDLQGELGYAPNSKNKAICAGSCHGADDSNDWSFGNFADFQKRHWEHEAEGIGCVRCHAFSR